VVLENINVIVVPFFPGIVLHYYSYIYLRDWMILTETTL
jgi:hypothetical protein